MDNTFTVQKLSSEPIVICHMTTDYEAVRDMADSDAAVQVILDRSNYPLFCVSDITRVSFNFDDLLFAVKQGAQGDTALWHHPMMREMIFVTTSPAVQMASSGMNTPMFGNLNIGVFETMEEALAHCRAQIDAE